MSTTKLKIAIFEDDEDILTLYKDFLIEKGHEVVHSLLNADNIVSNFLKNFPDIAIMDYKMQGHKNGIEAAIEILAKYPLLPILFITGYEILYKDIFSNSIFNEKKISILIKPVFLKEIEDAILYLVK